MHTRTHTTSAYTHSQQVDTQTPTSTHIKSTLVMIHTQQQVHTSNQHLLEWVAGESAFPASSEHVVNRQVPFP